MKSIVHKNKAITTKLIYPILMRCMDKIPKGMELVVLFTGLNTGMVVASNVPNRVIGSMAHDWVEADDTSTWEVFRGVVEMSN